MADRYGLVFNLYADRLGIDEASLACPDVGGSLYFSRHVIIDLGGLCHREIAGALTRGPGSLQDLILHRLQPTFIHLHGVWSGRYRLDEAPQFERDYVQIHRTVSLQQTPAGQRLHESGDWVRRDAVRDPSRLLVLQTEVEESWPAFVNEARLHRLPFPRDPTPTVGARPTLLPLNGS